MKLLRQCVACRRQFERAQLIRLLNDRLSGQFSYYLPGLEYEHAGSGRSAYCCARQECLKTALKGKKLQKALKTRIPDAILEGLEYALKGQIGSDGI